MMDSFKTHSRSLTSPPEEAAAIAPDDALELGFATRAIYVGGAGVRMLGGAVVTLAGVPAGSLLPLHIAQVLATATTATALVGFW